MSARNILIAAAGLGLVAMFAKEFPAIVREIKLMRM
jgi:hypothetical protein